MSERSEHDPEQPPVTITDKRRVSAVGEVPVPAAPQPEPGVEPSYLDDLLRLKAEFDNYRKRVERDRVEWATQAQARLVLDLLGVLDDVERARSFGELDPGFRAVADSLDKVLDGAGLERFGSQGEAFDPNRHEALVHQESAEVDHEQVGEVYRRGYTFAGRVLRPAQVVVTGPPPSTQPPAGEPGPDAAGTTGIDEHA